MLGEQVDHLMDGADRGRAAGYPTVTGDVNARLLGPGRDHSAAAEPCETTAPGLASSTAAMSWRSGVAALPRSAKTRGTELRPPPALSQAVDLRAAGTEAVELPCGDEGVLARRERLDLIVESHAAILCVPV